MNERWVAIGQLADEVGVTRRHLQRIRTEEPGVLVTRQLGAGEAEYKQPDCAINLRRREMDRARRESSATVSLDAARTRKALAEAELAELEVAQARAAALSVTDYEAALGKILERLSARLRSVPIRLAHLGTEVEAAAEAEAERVIIELHGWDEEVLEKPAPAPPPRAALEEGPTQPAEVRLPKARGRLRKIRPEA